MPTATDTTVSPAATDTTCELTPPVTPDKGRKQPAKVRGVFERPKDSGIWWVCYFDNGQKRREKVGRRSDAISLYQKRKNDIRVGIKLPENFRAPESEGTALATLIDRALIWYGTHRPKSLPTVKGQLATIKGGLGHLTAETLTAGEVDTWLSSHGEWTPATINRYKSALSKTLQLAMVNGDLKSNVARLVSARREDNARMRWLSHDEENRLRSAIEKLCPAQMAAFTVAVNTGMRKSEQFSLTWDEIDFDRKRIFLSQTKNGSNREVPMNKTVLAVLTDLRASQESKESESLHVFHATKCDKQLKNPREWFETALVEAKIENLRWHDLRHTFCSRLVMAGVNLRTVMELAGHKTIQMTTRYAHLAPEHNQEAIERLVGFKGAA
jgi:integrase